MKIVSTRQSSAAAPRVHRTALALAIGLSLASTEVLADAASSRADIRLSLDDVISSRPEAPAQTPEVDDRIAVHGLIQSHPDPILAQLEARYEALPPFTQAREDTPEQYIAEAGLQEGITEQARDIAEDLIGFMPRISSSVRYEDVDNRVVDSEGAAPEISQYQTALASVNPTFEYQRPLDRWHMKASYDYERKQYFIDRSAALSDHDMNVNFRRRLTRGSEFNVSTRWVNSTDRTTNDPIALTGQDLTEDDLNNRRIMLNFGYKKGTLRDRTRIRIASFNERASIRTNAPENDWELKEHGVKGSYTWQAKRQFSLVAEGRYSHSDYDVDFRDNSHVRLLVGSDLLLMNRRLRASIRGGYESKDFRIAQREDTSISLPVWQAEMELALRRTTKIRFETGREIYEHLEYNEAIDSNIFNAQEWVKLSWKQKWSDRLDTNVSYVIRDIDFRGQDNENSGDLFLAQAGYQLTNQVKLSLNASISSEETSLGSDLSRNSLTFRADYSL